MQRVLPSGSFFGETTASRGAGGFLFAESVYGRGTRIPPHVHENAFFYLVLEGRCAERSGPVHRENGPASLVFHPAGHEHANAWPEAGRCFHIELPGPVLRRLGEESPILSTPAEFQEPGTTALATRIYQECAVDDPLSPLALQALVLELLVAASRAGRPPVTAAPRWLRDARDLLHARFAEPLSLEEVAAAVGVHPGHLTRSFRDQYHCSIGEYVRRLRVEAARRELLRRDASLDEIALDAGFADQSHFTRVFKRYTGTTPAAYRRQLLGRPRDP